MRVLRILFIVALGLAAPAAAQAPSRVALVIANGAYQSVPALTNPARDGTLIVTALQRAGFSVGTLRRDLTKVQFDAALRDFKRQADSADIALIYYAGHGIELEEQNWLLPIDARIADPADALTEGVSLGTVLRYVQGAKRVRVVVLDACRDNPFAMRLVSATRSIANGLRPVDGLPPGTLVAYSASFGQRAADGQGAANSPFAAALAKRLVEPGLEVGLLFRAVHDDVVLANRSSTFAEVRNQRPWIGAALTSDQVYFVAPVAQPSIATLTVLGASVSASELGAEVEAFESAARANTAVQWRAFLVRFPNARLKGVAEQSLLSLERPTAPTTTTAAATDPLAAARTALAAITPQEWRAADTVSLVARAISGSSRDSMERLAAGGDANAQWVAGRAYEIGLSGFPLNKAEALRLYRLGAQQGNARAQASLGFMYEDGAGGLRQDKVEAARLYALAAAQGHATAQASLGYFYARGDAGLPLDKVEAVRLYRLAAAQGNAPAQINLGLMYVNGEGGVAEDKTEAVRLFRLAAAQGNARGQASLGYSYEVGEGGLTQDRAEAARLYRLASAQGDDAAQYNLGVMYSNGQGVPVDKVEGVRFYTLSANSGNAQAQNNLGVAYYNGDGGLAVNKVEAVRLYRLAVAQGHARAQSNLALMYENGEGGLTADRAEAVRLYKLSARQGNTAAQTNLRRLGETW